MSLTMHRHKVLSVSLGAESRIDAGHLTIDAGTLRAQLMADDRLGNVSIEMARPGDSTRIVCVKDVVQPRIKKTGSIQGMGVLGILEDVAVVTCGPIVGFQEGIIDMSGRGADYTPFSRMPLFVLRIEAAHGLGPHEHEAAVRAAGLNAAEFVAAVCIDAEPDTVEEIALEESPVDPRLPRVAYVYMVLSQGLLHDTYVFGRDAKDGLPVLANPGQVYDNGIVSGNCVSACDKTTTFHHQNNPIIAELLRGHGNRWNFAGIVITNAAVRLGEKERSAEAAVTLVTEMQASGAIVSKEGFGNPDADLMMLLQRLEKSGIVTVAITDEFAGNDGGSQSLADTVAEANAIVSTGNANERIVLPALAKTIGPLPDVSRLAGGYPHTLREDGSLEVELQAIIGATNELGFSHLSCREV